MKKPKFILGRDLTKYGPKEFRDLQRALKTGVEMKYFKTGNKVKRKEVK